jgi:ribokinase
VADWPDAGDAAEVRSRRELLGGKGANQAVGLAQRGVPVALCGVVGTDAVGAWLLEQATRDGIDTGCVLRRGSSALLVDITDGRGTRRLFEHVPEEALLRPGDVAANGELAGRLAAADTVCLQAQQPGRALRAALRHVTGARVVVDGALVGEAAEPVLNRSDVVRLDVAEAAQLADGELRDLDDVRGFAGQLLSRGPELVCIAVAQPAGDLVAWPGGEEFLGHDGPVVDPTGAGDAFVVGLVTALRDGAGAVEAGAAAVRAAGRAVQKIGGRPAG